jgi:DNA modification methylase
MQEQPNIRLHRDITLVRIDDLQPAHRNPRTHPRGQVKQIADSIRRFGFTNPVLVDDDKRILAGHGRVAAARLLGMVEVPALCVADLTPEERRAYVLADNKIALNAGWDPELLAIELQELIELDFEVELTGFSVVEIDSLLEDAKDASTEGDDAPEDLIPAPSLHAVCQQGDIWQLGRHRLLCGDARSAEDMARLMGAEQASIVFTDPPYNVPIDGHVCGSGSVRHREFAMASGEMSASEFTAFLHVTLGAMCSVLRSGTILYVCMDWRHMRELSEAGAALGLELKNLVVWNKSNGGMGTFYRSKHELIFVFKHGDANHVNNFGLGDGGRYRTNVWDYRGISSISATRGEELAMHPTVKPVALVADALRDCSRRGDIVLDPFAGSGTTLIAAQSVGRIARLIEFDPLHCDTILRRYRQYTGREPVLVSTGQSFEDIETRVARNAEEMA